MKVLFISKELRQTAGSGVCARMHMDSIREIVGDSNLYLIDMSVAAKPEKKDHYLAFGKYPSRINRIIRHLQGNTYYFSNSIIGEIVEYIKVNEIEVVFLDDSYFGRLAREIKKKCPKVRVLAFFHDVKAELFPIWIKRANLINKWDYKIAIKNEKISVDEVDANIVLNSEEDDLLRKYYDISADYYLPICVEKKEIDTNENPYESSCKKHILFVGTSYLPNLNATRWFVKEVFPEIRERYDFWVVGKGVECLREEITEPDVHIVGFVESLFPYYKNSDVVIAPLVDGGGMKIKTAEAFAYGKVFMGSSESLHGYYDCLSDKLKDSVVFRCDSANDYIAGFEKINKRGLERENQDLMNVYEMNYSHKASVEKMREILFS